MKKTLFAVAALLAASSAVAGDPNNPFTRDIPDPIPVLSPITFEVGTTVHRELYDAYGPAGMRVHEDGWMAGLKGAAALAFPRVGGKVVVSGEFSSGVSHAKATLGGNAGSMSARGFDSNLLELTALYKQNVPLWTGLSLEGGLGYRRQANNLSGGGAGLDDTSNRLYVVAGVEQNFVTSRWTISPSIQGKYALYSHESGSYTGPVTGDFSVNQHGGYGLQAAVAMAYRGNGHNLAVTPYYRYWYMPQSGSDAAFAPQSKTQEMGVELTVQF